MREFDFGNFLASCFIEFIHWNFLSFFFLKNFKLHNDSTQMPILFKKNGWHLFFWWLLSESPRREKSSSQVKVTKMVILHLLASRKIWFSSFWTKGTWLGLEIYRHALFTVKYFFFYLTLERLDNCYSKCIQWFMRLQINLINGDFLQKGYHFQFA